MFPLKNQAHDASGRKITGAGTTALNGDIDSNGSITPLLGRAAGTQAARSVSDNVRTPRRASPRLGSGAPALGQDGHGCMSPLPGALGPGRVCPGHSWVCSAPAPQLQGSAATSPLTHGDFGRAVKCGGATAQGCQVSRSHGSTTQRCQDEKSVGVLMLTHQLQTDLPCSSTATAGLPQIPAPAPWRRAPARRCPARSLRYPSSVPAPTAAGALCLLSTSV